MNSNAFAFGRYKPLSTPIHHFDGRLKFVSFILLVAVIFLNTGFTGQIICLALVLGLHFLSGLRVSTLLNLTKPLIFMSIILFLINWIILRGNDEGGVIGYNDFYNNEIIQNWGGTSWYALNPYAIYQTIYIVLRIYIMMVLTSILTATTSPMELTMSLEDLMTPLRWIKLPVHEMAMMVAIALRFIPTLIDESQKIMKSQASRGIDFENGKWGEKTKGLISLIIPLFVGAFQKAEDLANAMEARGYSPRSPRTRFRVLRFRFIDLVYFLMVACFFTWFILWTTLFANNTNFFIPIIDIFKNAHLEG